jgi:tRNA C32,U32 (ribose-2'-O)-methylase TrmJ
LELCHFLLHIPTAPAFSSLNVAAAVQIVAYELFLMDRSGEGNAETAPLLASSEELESFYRHLEAMLRDIRFLHERKAGDSTMRRLRRIFNRSRIEEREIHLLRGVLSTMQYRLKSGGE